MIVTFTNLKGGVGKSTLALAMGFVFDGLGKKVALLDYDPQQSATQSVEELKAQGLCSIEAIDKIPADKRAFDLIVVDTKPDLNTDLDKAVIHTDRVVIVVGQSPLELKSTQRLIDHIKPLVLPNVPQKILFNRIKANTRLGDMIDDVIAILGVERYQNVIPDNVAYQSMPLVGLSALSAEQRLALTNTVLEIMTA